jgi:hypothetical protein
MMTEHLGRGAEQLRKAVRHLANGSGTSQEKLTSMYNETGFGTIYEGDFPEGSLRDAFHDITGQMGDGIEPHLLVTAMSDERARRVIEQICCLSDAAAYPLGRQGNSA